MQPRRIPRTGRTRGFAERFERGLRTAGTRAATGAAVEQELYGYGDVGTFGQSLRRQTPWTRGPSKLPVTDPGREHDLLEPDFAGAWCK
jgi:hypothetical protein